MRDLLEIEPAECERLLRRCVFGRLVLTTPQGVEVVPVNYAVIDDAIVVRTADTGLLARFAHLADVVFQIDEVDHERWQGWSVVGRGRATVHDASTTSPSTRPTARPWAGGERDTEVRVRWTSLSGRRIGAGWRLDDLGWSRRSTP